MSKCTIKSCGSHPDLFISHQIVLLSSLSFMMRFQVLIAFAASLYITLSNAQSIASFYSTKGPTVVSLDALSGNFSYNVYAAKGFSSMKSFAPTVPAKKGTSIACVGYSTNSTVYVCHIPCHLAYTNDF